MSEKKAKTPEQIYKKNQLTAKWLKRIAPIVFWGCLALAFLCLVLAIRNSFGNIAEIIDLLDKNRYTGDELRANYDYLLGKYGEWVIGTGGSGFQITFVNIGKAMFSGFMITNSIFALVFLLCAVFLGKLLLPRLADQVAEQNQDMVNLTVLKNAKE